MTKVDKLLSDSLKRIAEPGDASGVAAAIRARVAAGDGGTPAASSGFGSGTGLSWTRWVGLAVVVGLVGGVLGVLGARQNEVLVAAPTGVLLQTTPAHLCAGGVVVGPLFAGDRVLAVMRSKDSSWLGIRNPDSLTDTIWLPASVVSVDEDQNVAALPTGGACPVVTGPAGKPEDSAPNGASGPTAGPTEGPTPQPTPKPTPGPKPDKTAPSISVGSFSPQPVYGTAAAPYCSTKATVNVTASDNVGVVSVKGSANTAKSSVKLASKSGSNYAFTFSAPYSSGSPKIVTVAFTATDAAGNHASAARTLVLKSSGDCLI